MLPSDAAATSTQTPSTLSSCRARATQLAFVVAIAALVATLVVLLLPSSTPLASLTACSVLCNSTFLTAALRAGLLANDSKTIVDRPLLTDPADVLAAFDALPPDVSPSAFAAFVDAHFGEAGSDLVEVRHLTIISNHDSTCTHSHFFM